MSKEALSVELAKAITEGNKELVKKIMAQLLRMSLNKRG